MKLSEMHNKPATTGRKMRIPKELCPKKRPPCYGPRRWKDYQGDSPRYKGVKMVSDMTEAEAKDELCDAMDLIQVLKEYALGSMIACEQKNY